jgi:hypothetical protein
MKHIKLFEMFASEYEGPYKLLIKYSNSIWDDDGIFKHLSDPKTIADLENALGKDKLAKAEVLILDVGLDGLPFPDDDEFEPIRKHKNFEAFKDVINYINDNIVMDDELEW